MDFETLNVRTLLTTSRKPMRACLSVWWGAKRHDIQIVQVMRMDAHNGTMQRYPDLWALPGGLQVNTSELENIAEIEGSILRYRQEV